jgi:hypothetical protein
MSEQLYHFVPSCKLASILDDGMVWHGTENLPRICNSLHHTPRRRLPTGPGPPKPRAQPPPKPPQPLQPL